VSCLGSLGLLLLFVPMEGTKGLYSLFFMREEKRSEDPSGGSFVVGNWPEDTWGLFKFARGSVGMGW